LKANRFTFLPAREPFTADQDSFGRDLIVQEAKRPQIPISGVPQTVSRIKETPLSR
jgi:hypothetical protein